MISKEKYYDYAGKAAGFKERFNDPCWLCKKVINMFSENSFVLNQIMYKPKSELIYPSTYKPQSKNYSLRFCYDCFEAAAGPDFIVDDYGE